MKLRNKRGNICGAQYYTGTGAERTEVTVSVGPETVELSQVHGEYMLNLFGRELEVIRDAVAAPTNVEEPGKAPEPQVPNAPTDSTNFEPNVGSDAPPPVVDGDQYYCSKCKKAHRKEGSKIGAKHRQYAV